MIGHGALLSEQVGRPGLDPGTLGLRERYLLSRRSARIHRPCSGEIVRPIRLRTTQSTDLNSKVVAAPGFRQTEIWGTQVQHPTSASRPMIDRLMCFGVDLSPMLSLALIARHYLRTSVQAQSEPSMRITIRRVRSCIFHVQAGIRRHDGFAAHGRFETPRA